MNQGPINEITIPIITTIGVVMVDVAITWDIYTQCDFEPPGRQGNGILSWCYTILGAKDRHGRPYYDTLNYRDQIMARITQIIKTNLP